MIRITKFECGKFNKNPNQDRKTWEAAQELLTELLTEANTFDGDYVVRVHRKIRWQGNHENVPYKVSRYEHGKVYVTVKPLGKGNDSVFEYAISGAFERWNERAAYFAIRDYIDELLFVAQQPAAAETKEAPVVQEATVTPPQKLSVVERIARLEAAAVRNQEREAEIEQITNRIEAVRQEVAERQATIKQLEAEQLNLMEAMEADTECREAQESLAALEKLLA